MLQIITKIQKQNEDFFKYKKENCYNYNGTYEVNKLKKLFHRVFFLYNITQND